MNKYTLNFKYKKLEDEYLQQRTQTLKIPVFYAGSVCIFIVALYKMIYMLIQDDLEYIIFIVICQVFTIFSVILIRFRIHKVNIQLIILAYLMVCYEMLIQNDVSREALNLYSGNFTYCSLIIILISEYKDSVIIIVTCLFFKLLYTIIIDTQRSYTTYFASILLMFFLGYFSYKLNIQSRLNFLHNQQDYIWENIFPIIFDKPYMIIKYNEENFEFSLKSSKNLNFQCQDNQQLKKFLREWKNNQNTIELILFQSFMDKNQTDIISSTIEVYNNKKEKISIKYTILKMISSIIIISIEQKCMDIKDYYKNINNIKIQQQKISYSIINFFYQNLFSALKSCNKSKLFELRKTLFLTLLNYRINKIQQKSQIFDSNCLSEIQELFFYKELSLQYIDYEPQKTYFVQAYLERLIFEVCKNSIPKSSIYISFGDESIIIYYGKFINFNKQHNFEQVWDSLVDKFERKGNQITIFLNKEQNIQFKESIN